MVDETAPSAQPIPRPQAPVDPDLLLDGLAQKDIADQISDLESLHRELTTMLSRAQA
ncbi:hypothetical protein [Arcanobacterium pinnipediorum]|uniref:Uncharacterized protein n=1 Tax=Arcanobacterium pinnipediorum TaxID=1503041 RepID=A0ABY5AET4_9ACTO|nr:hypothetical protein [Arcanobacterium pinnipediorum]USR78709.1 hypothetical protein NG665_04760 [Arcanobacterium pinnipediorum]